MVSGQSTCELLGGTYSVKSEYLRLRKLWRFIYSGYKIHYLKSESFQCTHYGSACPFPVSTLRETDRGFGLETYCLSRIGCPLPRRHTSAPPSLYRQESLKVHISLSVFWSSVQSLGRGPVPSSSRPVTPGYAST